MISGIFFVSFATNISFVGEGLVVITNGDINGGDEGYLYRGHVYTYGEQSRATIEVNHYRGVPNSVFGPIKNFSLDLTGEAGNAGFNLTGSIVGHKVPLISIKGVRVADVFELAA